MSPGSLVTIWGKTGDNLVTIWGHWWQCGDNSGTLVTIWWHFGDTTTPLLTPPPKNTTKNHKTPQNTTKPTNFSLPIHPSLAQGAPLVATVASWWPGGRDWCLQSQSSFSSVLWWCHQYKPVRTSKARIARGIPNMTGRSEEGPESGVESGAESVGKWGGVRKNRKECQNNPKN